MYQNEDTKEVSHGYMDREVMEFMQKAMTTKSSD